MDLRRRDVAARAALVALGLCAFALRLAYRIHYDEDIDALRFALAVEKFDVSALRPHAPFYPVYVALAKALALFTRSGNEALGWLSALSGASAVVLVALLADELIGRRAAWIAGALALASPFLWLSSEKLSSDIAGTAVVTAALLLAVKARRSSCPGNAHSMRTSALFVLGLGLGVRLSYFPFALACLWTIAAAEGGGLRVLVARSRDLLVGVVLWLAPLVVLAGARALVAVTWVQTLGHFTRWGGTVVTVSSPARRAYGVAWGAWAHVLGGAWPDAPRLRWLSAPILVLLIVVAARSAAPWRDFARRHPEIVLSALLYLLWVVVGQNVAYKPRHLLPLCPLFIVALAQGADALASRTRAALALSGSLAVLWMIDGEHLVRAHLAPSPAASLVELLREGAGRRAVITRELEAMIASGAPALRVLRVRDDDALLGAVEAESPAGVFITGEAMAQGLLDTLGRRGRLPTLAFSRPRSRYVDPLWHELALFEIKPVNPSP